MERDDRSLIQRRPILALAAALALITAAGALARGAVPPPFVTWRQDCAVRAYCAEWRKTHGKLNADEMNRRVITRLQKQYPMVFPDCRPKNLQTCLGWVNALVQGLRRYGPRSLKSVCSSFHEIGCPVTGTLYPTLNQEHPKYFKSARWNTALAPLSAIRDLKRVARDERAWSRVHGYWSAAAPVDLTEFLSSSWHITYTQLICAVGITSQVVIASRRAPA